jgi:hypothetical protein
MERVDTRARSDEPLEARDPPAGILIGNGTIDRH